MITRRRHQLLLPYLLVCLQSCASITTLTLEDLEMGWKTDVFVTTTQQRTIHMLEGQYRIIRTDSVLVLQGTGEYLPNQQPEGLRYFSGRLLSTEILSIESRHSTAIGILIFGLPIIFLALIAIG